MRSNTRIGKATAAAFALLGALMFAAPVRAQAPEFPVLSEQLEPLREQFNADAGKVRLILILDPT